MKTNLVCQYTYKQNGLITNGLFRDLKTVSGYRKRFLKDKNKQLQTFVVYTDTKTNGFINYQYVAAVDQYWDLIAHKFLTPVEGSVLHHCKMEWLPFLGQQGAQ
jgi:hypothetical protein